MQVFNLAEELEKERKKNKELEKELNLYKEIKKEYSKYLPEDVECIILTKPDYDRQQEELLDKVFELEQELKEANESITWWSNRYNALEEEHKNCTRKHWQEKCAEHCANEKILQNRIDKSVKKLQLIIDIGFDYDGYDSPEELKKLIDELVKYAEESKSVLEGE